MILIDANVLLYAYDPSSPHHQDARVWFETAISKPGNIGLAWMTLLAFVHMSTSSRPLEHPLSATEALAIVAGWLEHPRSRSSTLANGIGRLCAT
jgi:predicted nucleic acid-binding protein